MTIRSLCSLLLLVTVLLLESPGASGFGLGLIARTVKAKVTNKIRIRRNKNAKEDGVVVCDNKDQTLSDVATTIKVIHSPDYTDINPNPNANPAHEQDPSSLLEHPPKKPSKTEDASTTISTRSKHHLVNFSASKTMNTPAFPLHPSNQRTLEEFFQRQETCDYLFAEDASYEIIDSPSNDLLELFRQSWSSPLRKQQQDITRNSHPKTIPTRYVALTNPPMGFVGLQLYSVAYVAIQILNHSSPQKSAAVLPEFQYTLLTTCFRAEGPRFMVWLFQKLMGSDRPPKGSSSDDSIPTSRLETSGFTCVSTELAMEDDPSMIRFRNTAKLQGCIRIPNAFLKMLPMSTEQLQTQGSQTIQTAIEQDMEPAMERLQEAYQEWLKE